LNEVKANSSKARKSLGAPQARMPAEDRRQQILEVAVELFSQKGFRGTTTKEIAQAAGVNEAIIFRHFATKSELYAAIIDQKARSEDVQAWQTVLKEAMERSDDRHVFGEVAFRILEFHRHDDTAMRILFYSALESNELSRMIFRNHIMKTNQQLAAYVKKRIAEGAFRRVDLMTAVRAFMGMVMGHALITKFFGDDAREWLNISNRQAADRFTEIFLAGIRQTSAPATNDKRK
jgi:AcrR family transcriptional regulator